MNALDRLFVFAADLAVLAMATSVFWIPVVALFS